MKNTLIKIFEAVGNILIYLGILFAGFMIGCVVMMGKMTKEGRENYEYVNLLKCEQERYEYCPYCGKELSYKYHTPLSDETIEDLLSRYDDWEGNNNE